MLLKNIKFQNETLKEIEKEIQESTIEFNNIKLDFLVIILYANFERDLSNLINEHILKDNTNIYCQNYINYVNPKNQNAHRGIGKDNIKELIKKVFNKSLNELITEDELKIYDCFIQFRHSIAHWQSDEFYTTKKRDLLLNIKTTDELIAIIEKILNAVKDFEIIEPTLIE